MREIPVEVGQQFWCWTVLKELSPQKNHRRVKCRCDCGSIRIRNLQSIRDGLSRSCGCRRSDAVKRHGMWSTTEYTIWSQMKQRCYNPKSPNYHKYGGRGIGVCDRWRESFADFLADVGMRPSPAHSLDRYPDNDGDYEVGNVRWATIAQQAVNKRGQIWQRIVLLLAGDAAENVRKMVSDRKSDVEISRYIAATFANRRAAA